MVKLSHSRFTTRTTTVNEEGMESSHATASGSNSSSSCNAEVKHLADRLNTAQVKVKRLARLEAAIVDFFMEIMERTASLPMTNKGSQHQQNETIDSDNAFARAKRKEEFVRKAEGDPIALLNGLRTHLRVQFTTIEGQHHEMERTIAKLTTRGERNAQDAEDELRRWETACDVCKQQMRAISQQLTVAQDDHDRVTRQYKRSLEQLNTELHALRAKNDAQAVRLTKQQADIDELKHSNDMLARDRKRVVDEPNRSGTHARGSGVVGSPTNVMSTPSAGPGNAFLVGYTPAEQQNLKRVLQDYEFKLSKLESVNDDLREELRRQQQNLASLQQSTQAQHCAKLEKDVKKVKETVDALNKRLSDQEADLLRTRGALKERDTRIQSMKDEYNKLFTALQKIKQPTGSQPRPLARSASTASIGLKKGSSSRNLTARGGDAAHGAGVADRGAVPSNEELLRQEANENPYLLEHYKAKIEQQEKELLQMQTQIRKMIASEYRHKQKNKLFTAERGQLKDTCDNLKCELERAVKTSAKAMAQHQQSMGIVDDGDDVDRAQFKPSMEPQDHEASSEDEDAASATKGSNQLCCTVSDVLRLRQRNLYLEERFRNVMDGSETAVQASAATKEARPPRPSSSSRLSVSATPLTRSSSTAEIPTLPIGQAQKSIDERTMQALQRVKRPQSASARATLTSKPSVAIKSLL